MCFSCFINSQNEFKQGYMYSDSLLWYFLSTNTHTLYFTHELCTNYINIVK